MASSCKSNGQKNSILTHEYLYYIQHKCVSRRIYGGSAADGTNLEDSDFDEMIVDSNITACTERDQSKNIKGQVFILDSSVCSPGFARLIPVKLDPNIKTLFNNHGKAIDDMLETIEGDKTFLSSDKTIDFWMYFQTKTKTADTPTEIFRHGPSVTSVYVYGDVKKKTGSLVIKDFVFAISLYEWPIDGEEWIARERIHGWPSPKFIEKITKLKCHVVAVGDKMSPTSSLEWRVSFLLQEMELLRSFNDTQLQCFILMKNILKKFLHAIAPEELSSYHMKTILLWQSENNPQHLWQPKNLLRCTVNCLLFLKHCIEKRHLEHYIDRRKNLFSYRFENHIFKENMIKCIEDISADIVSHVLQCVDGVDLLSPWKDSEMVVNDFLQLCREKLDFKIINEFETFRLPLEYFHKARSVLGVNLEIVFLDFELLSQYFVSFGDNNPITEIEDSFIEAVRMFINIRIALTLLETIINVQDNQQQKLKKLQKFLEDNLNIDALSGKLYLATYCLRLQNSQKVIAIIRSILDSPSQNILYIGKCSKCKTIHIGNGTATQLKGLPNPFDHKKVYLSTAHDVIFSSADLSIVPHALKFECFIKRGFLIHPLVYMLYLAVISSECDQEVYMYMDALESTVNECEGSLHNYRHLNILGCSYFHVGDYKKAFECYTKSLMQTVPTGRQTAAVFHLIILMFHVINNGNGEECIYKRQ